ncbi:hypothetical protein F4801DRAFT_599768 [Xylaria longipes]|nr:hypothetical protein F4801DRAFT_599768 [Xylaria longipes]RYC61540.1 hypothetical protein CHU98_g4664 [Xylaria longipes]
MLKRLRILRKPRSYGKRPRGHGLLRCVAKYSELWTNTWLWEILSIVLSGICIILIFVILKIYEQKPVPKFTYGITLNAIISTLTTFSKSFLLVTVAGAISQLKWRWFQNTEGRRVFDTQLFDDASRGPYGSLIFLARPSRWSLASIGALISILALAFEPFTQQLITYPTRKTKDSTPGAEPPNLYRAKSYLAGPPYVTVAELQNRLVATLWDPTNEAESFATAHCSTGNCTWEEFESLAFCTSCQNKTSGIELSDTTLFWNRSVAQQAQDAISQDLFGQSYPVEKPFSLHMPADFPCDIDSNLTIVAEVFASHSGRYIYASDISYPRHLFGTSSSDIDDASFDYRGVNVYKDGFPLNLSDFSKWQSRRLPILRFCHVELESVGHDGPESLSARQATLCYLTPCVKRYSFSISNGIPILNTLGERYGSWYFNATGLKSSNGTLYYSKTGNLFEMMIGLSWADVPGKNGLVLNENSTYPALNLSSIEFGLGQENIFPFSNTASQYNGQVSVTEGFADVEQNRISNKSGIQFKKSFLVGSGGEGIIDTQTLNLRRIADKGGLTWAMPRIAAAASRFLRDQGAIPVAGRAYTFIIIVEVRWPWLVLPATTWLCGAVFLMLTIWFCRGSDRLLWKTSSLPLIYHGFEDHDVKTIKTTGDRLEHVSGMEKYSQNLYARIRRDSIDGQLKLMRTLQPT